jgi:hypothetical protein
MVQRYQGLSGALSLTGRRMARLETTQKWLVDLKELTVGLLKAAALAPAATLKDSK